MVNRAFVPNVRFLDATAPCTTAVATTQSATSCASPSPPSTFATASATIADGVAAVPAVQFICVDKDATPG